jgi:hypothetical protein
LFARRPLAADAIPLWLVSPQLVNTFLPGRFLTQENSEGIRVETGEENRKYSKNIFRGEEHPEGMGEILEVLVALARV